MSELRRLRVVAEEPGFFHVYVNGTDIELSNVAGCRVEMEAACERVLHLKIYDPEVEVKPARDRKS